MFDAWGAWQLLVCVAQLGFVETNSSSFTSFDKIGWCEKSLLGTYSTSFFGLSHIRWCEKACLAQALHPISVSTESDGMKKACLAGALHPITSSAISDGVPAQKRSNLLHPSTLSIKSDGVPARNVRVHYIQSRHRPIPMVHLQLNAFFRPIRFKEFLRRMEPAPPQPNGDAELAGANRSKPLQAPTTTPPSHSKSRRQPATAFQYDPSSLKITSPS